MMWLNYKSVYGAPVPASQKGCRTEEFGFLDSKVEVVCLGCDAVSLL
jgi:hypothetical protein